MIYCICNCKGGVSKTTLVSNVLNPLLSDSVVAADNYKMDTRRGRNEGFSKSTILRHGLNSICLRGVKK
jgi:hypothetical protein